MIDHLVKRGGRREIVFSRDVNDVDFLAGGNLEKIVVFATSLDEIVGLSIGCCSVTCNTLGRSIRAVRSR